MKVNKFACANYINNILFILILILILFAHVYCIFKDVIV